MAEIWYTLEDIKPSDNGDRLYCITVDSPDKQFQVGHMGVPTHNSEAGKEEDALKGEAAMIIGSVARLGRAAGVHLVIATQRPDAKILAGETKANLGVRINCGRTDSNASSMILGSSEGVRVKANPRGRLFLKIYGSGDHGQGFFADPKWIDEYLESKGLNPDGTPLGGKRSRLAHVTDLSEFEGADLDAREGVDNASVIERIRQEEAQEEDFFQEFAQGAEEEDDEGGFTYQEEEERQDNWTAPALTGGDNDEDKWSRPEDTWDAELEQLIEDNFS